MGITSCAGVGEGGGVQPQPGIWAKETGSSSSGVVLIRFAKLPVSQFGFLAEEVASLVALFRLFFLHFHTWARARRLAERVGSRYPTVQLLTGALQSGKGRRFDHNRMEFLSFFFPFGTILNVEAVKLRRLVSTALP